MAERHKSKYKKPENKKPTYRKDLKDYTYDDKQGGLNPKSTGDKQLNVLRKTDKKMQDDGKLYPTYNADDRLYKDIEDGEWEPKIAAKRLKKRQDAEEKETANVLRDKIENLTREQREYVLRKYLRNKITNILREQSDPNTKTPADAPDAAATPTTPDAAATPTTPDAAATPTTPDAAATPTTPDAAATDTKDSENVAQKQISPETKEALDVDRFVKYLNKQDGNIAKVKSLLKVINLATKELDSADIANTFKMLKIASTKKLAKLNQETTSKK